VKPAKHVEGGLSVSEGAGVFLVPWTIAVQHPVMLWTREQCDLSFPRNGSPPSASQCVHDTQPSGEMTPLSHNYPTAGIGQLWSISFMESHQGGVSTAREFPSDSSACWSTCFWPALQKVEDSTQLLRAVGPPQESSRCSGVSWTQSSH
jgi:hypothetical protein